MLEDELSDSFCDFVGSCFNFLARVIVMLTGVGLIILNIYFNFWEEKPKPWNNGIAVTGIVLIWCSRGIKIC